MRNRGDVGDRADLQADSPQGTDGSLTTGAGTLNEDVNPLHAMLHGATSSSLSGHLSGERGGLTGALEADSAGRGPRDHCTRGVSNSDDGVVERALDVRLTGDDVLLLLAAHLGLGCTLVACSSHVMSLLKSV